MHKENVILSQIEELVDKLPYRFVKIEVELDSKTLTRTKDRQRSIFTLCPFAAGEAPAG